MLVLNLAAHSFQCPSNPPRFATPRAASPAMLSTEAEILAQIEALKAQLELSKLEKMNAALTAQIQAAASAAPTEAPAQVATQVTDQITQVTAAAPEAVQAVQTATESHGVSIGAITAVAILATGVANLGFGQFFKPPWFVDESRAPAAAASAPAATSFLDKVEKFVDAVLPKPTDATSAVFKQPMVRGRSAPDIIADGFGNLLKEPLGWCFGPPSALYSNIGATAAGAVAGSAPWSGMAKAAMAAMPDAAAKDPAAFMEEAKRAWLATRGQGQQSAAQAVMAPAGQAAASAANTPSSAWKEAPWRAAAMAAAEAMPEAAKKDPQAFVEGAKKAWLAQQAKLFPPAVAPAEPAADSAAWVETEKAKRAWLSKQQAPAWGPGSASRAGPADDVAKVLEWASGGGGAAAAPAATMAATATATAAAPSAVAAEAQRMREQLAAAEAELDKAQAAVELARAGAPGAPDYATSVQRARAAIDQLQHSAIAVKATQQAAASAAAKLSGIGGGSGAAAAPVFDTSNAPWRAAALAAMEAMPEAAAKDPQAFVDEAKRAWFAANGQNVIGRVVPTAMGPRGRSAQDIFWKGVDNLVAEPFGWFFGPETSALYSSGARN